MQWLESLTRNGILATRNDVIRHNDPSRRQDYQTPVVLKIKATRASVKALRGYHEHVGAAVLPLTNHTYT